MSHVKEAVRVGEESEDGHPIVKLTPHPGSAVGKTSLQHPHLKIQCD